MPGRVREPGLGAGCWVRVSSVLRFPSVVGRAPTLGKARPGQSHGKVRAEQTSPLFLTLRVCVSCRARDVELCCLWALSERDCDRMEVLTTIPPGIVFEGFLKIALSRPAWFSWLHSRRPRRTLTRADLRCSELPRSHSETGRSSVSRRLRGRARREVVFQAWRAINLSR